MYMKKYIWSILLAALGGSLLAQEEVIELQENIKHIPQNKEHLLELVKIAESKTQYTLCGDFYRWAEYEQNEKKRKVLDKKAIKFYKKAIKNGEVAAYHRMAYMCHTGRGANIRDYVDSYEYLEIAANKGYLPAQYNLGILYLYTGKNLVEKDVEKAEAIFIKIANKYSKEIHPPSIKLSDNSLRKLSIQYLIDLYTNPNISPKGKKLNLKKAIEWSNVIEDHSILERLYEKLSDYEELKKWIGLYHSFIPGLRRNYDLSTIESVKYAIDQHRYYLYPIGEQRLYEIEKAIFNTFFKTDVGLIIRTHHETLQFLEGVKKYILPQKSTDYNAQNTFLIKAKTIEVALTKQYDPQNIFKYLNQINERNKVYSEMGNIHYQELQKIALEPLRIDLFSEKSIERILLLIGGPLWKESTASKRIMTKGEQTLWKKGKKDSSRAYLKGAKERWKTYTKSHQQLCFDVIRKSILIQSESEQKVQLSKELKFLIVPPYSILTNAKNTQEEILGLIDIAQTLQLTYDFIRFETVLLKANNTLCIKSYQSNFTSKTDLDCRADEQYYQMKKRYYQAFLNRLRVNKVFTKEGKNMTSFWKLLLSEEKIGISYHGERHSFKNLWIFLHEFVLKLTPDEYKIWLQQFDEESKKLLGRAIQNSGKIRLHALVKHNAQYSLKWHAEHTSPNCIPLWSQEVKSRCPFCFFPASGVYYNTENEYDIYSPLEYAEMHMNNPNLVQVLKRLGVQKDQRDKTRREKEKIQRDKDQKLQAIEEEKQKQHSKFLATLKVGDCVSGYIYFDCKPPFFAQEYFRIKVSGRLITVTQNEYRECFIKITSIKKIDRRSSNQWIETSGFRACDENKWYFLDKEHSIEKQDILSLCY